MALSTDRRSACSPSDVWGSSISFFSWRVTCLILSLWSMSETGLKLPNMDHHCLFLASARFPLSTVTSCTLLGLSGQEALQSNSTQYGLADGTCLGNPWRKLQMTIHGLRS